MIKTKLFIKIFLVCVIASLSGLAKENLRKFKYDKDFAGRNCGGFFRKRFRETFKQKMNSFSGQNSSAIGKNGNIFYTSPPGNDNFANAFTISGAAGSTNGSNVAATHEKDEPWIIPFIVNGTNSVWWRWTCPASGLYGFDTICSGFSSALGIFTGTALSNLNKITYGNYIQFFNGSIAWEGYVNFNAISGETYHIAVSGRISSDEGNILLNWYPETLVVYSNLFSTNFFHSTATANNGSIIQAHYLEHKSTTYKTNIKEIIVTDFLYENTFTNFTVIDRKNRKINDTNIFSDITGKVRWLEDFDGKRILVSEYKTSTNLDAYVHLYSVTKKGLKKINTYYVSNNFGFVTLSKKWIYIYITDWKNWADIKLLALNKSLKKVAWVFKPSLNRGGLFPVFSSGVAVYRQWDPTTDLFFEVGKKGKPYANHVLKQPVPPEYINFFLDDKGGILYWIYENGTNKPMTYLDRKNKEKVKDFSPDSFSLFNTRDFDGKTLVLGKVNAGSIDIRSYKWGKKPKLNGETTIANYIEFMLVDSKLYIIKTNGSNISVCEYDKKLKKVKWENSGQGYDIEYLGKKVFCRENSNATTKTFTIFKKEKEIAEHVIDN